MRPSLQVTATAELAPDLMSERLDREVEALLTQRLLDDGHLAAAAHVVLAIVAGSLVWGSGYPRAAVVWTGSLTGAVLLRLLLQRQAFWARSARRALNMLRVGILLLALTWGVGAASIDPRLPIADLAILLVLFSGLVAGATSSLLADLPSFYLFLAGTMLPMAIGFARNGSTYRHIVVLILILFYSVAMLVFHRRAHVALRDHLRTSTRLSFAEAEASRERTMLEALISGAPNAIAVISRMGAILRINQTFEKLFGYSAREAVGRRLNEMVLPVSETETSRALQERVWAGETVVLEAERQRKDGTRLIVRLAASAVKIGDDQLGFVTYDDVTNAVRAREALRESEERLFQVLDRMPIGVFVVNDKGETHFANEAARQYLGQGIVAGSSIAEAAERHGVMIAGTNTPYPLDRMPVARAVRGERTEIEDMEIIRPDGTRRWIEALGSPITNADSKVVYGVAVFTDVTEKRAATRRLKEAEEQYRRVVDAASDLVWRLDMEGKFTLANPAALGIYGLRPEELIGKSFVDFADQHHREADRKILQEVLGGRHVENHETIHRDVQGNPRHLSTSAYPVWDMAGGRVAAVHGIARDVTEQVTAREALLSARDAAEKATAAKSSFLANMSHEIRTPMNGVLGMVELMLETELSPEQRRSAELIAASGEALMAIINDILDFSKIEAGQLDIENIEFELPPVIDSAARLQITRAQQRGLEMVVDVKPDVPHRVVGDPTRIRQVINNLLGNAIKFTHQGEIEIAVRLEGAQNGAARVRFSVRDTGIGISDEQKRAIFEPFKQADISTSRRYGGTGLGLSISRKLVELMGATLDVTSEPGKGSEFSFLLSMPVVEGQAAVVPRHSLHDVKVLVVDDHPTNRRVITEMLAWGGCLSGEASSADDGLEALREAAGDGVPYALLVTDVHMPGRDGFEFAAAVRGDPAVGGIPIMVLTSGGRKGDGQRCRDLGIGAYLLKPVSRTELIEAAVGALSGPVARSSEMRLITRHTFEENRRNLRILLAEDNPVNQEVAAAMLRKRGHTVDITNNGREALEAAAKTTYDVILMDIQMPEMDGLTATAEIRKLPTPNPIPIIALTANAMSGERERCLAAGMDEYLAKPFRPHDLFAIVEGWGTPEAATPVPDKAKGVPVDIEGLRAELRLAGVEEIAADLLNTFLADGPSRILALRQAAEGTDPGAIERAAHAYKSAAATVKAQALAGFLKETEFAARAGDLPNARILVSRVELAHDEACAYVRQTLGGG